MRKTIVRDASINDLIFIARIHKELFSNYYLGLFSIKLIKLFYSSFINNNVIFLVSETSGIINGFVLGGERKEINKCNSYFIKKNIPQYTFEIIFKPSTWSESFRKFINVISSKDNSKKTQRMWEVTHYYQLVCLPYIKEKV